jgi:acyl dehydratase
VAQLGGLYYEQFEVGRVHRHPFTRTVTESDNVLITSLTMNAQPLHLDHEKASIHGQCLVNSLFTLGLVSSFPIIELTMNTTLGNLGFDQITFPRAVFVGDTLHAETTPLDKRLSESRADSGIVCFEHRGYNQVDQLICTCKRAALMKRGPQD